MGHKISSTLSVSILRVRPRQFYIANPLMLGTGCQVPPPISDHLTGSYHLQFVKYDIFIGKIVDSERILYSAFAERPLSTGPSEVDARHIDSRNADVLMVQ